MSYDDEFLNTKKVIMEMPTPEGKIYNIDEIKVTKGRNKAKVSTIFKGTLQAAEILTDGKVCCHNFANPYKPCWDIVTEMTQEEVLFRQTNISAGLKREYYPIHDKIIYNSNVFIIKDYDECTGRYHIRKDFKNIEMISSAAIHRPRLVNGKYKKSDYELTEKLISGTLYVAWANKVTHFITGAWGCGCFANPVGEVVKIWDSVLTHQVEVPPNIVFAIPDFKIDHFQTLTR